MGRTFLATVLVLASLTGAAATACRDQVADLKGKIAAETDPIKRGSATKQINDIDTMSEVDCGNAVVRAWRELRKPSQQSIAEQQRLKASAAEEEQSIAGKSGRADRERTGHEMPPRRSPETNQPPIGRPSF